MSNPDNPNPNDNLTQFPQADGPNLGAPFDGLAGAKDAEVKEGQSTLEKKTELSQHPSRAITIDIIPDEKDNFDAQIEISLDMAKMPNSGLCGTVLAMLVRSIAGTVAKTNPNVPYDTAINSVCEGFAVAMANSEEHDKGNVGAEAGNN